MSTVHTEADLIERLRKRYEAPAWALMPHCGNTTGWNKCRTADAIAMSLWPSRGLEVHGFEIKIHRGDWVQELKHPEKAEPIMRFCDHWWIVVGDKKIIQPGELPPTWGLIVPNGTGLKSVTEAPKLEAEPWTRGFFAAVLRRAADCYLPKAQLDAAFAAGAEQGKKANRSEVNYQMAQAEEYKTAIKVFEEKSGVRISTWDGGRIGDAVRLVMSNAPSRYRDQLKRVLEDARGVVRGIEAELRVAAEHGESDET